MPFTAAAAHRLSALAPSFSLAGWTLRLISVGTDLDKRDFFATDRHPFLEIVVIEQGRGQAESSGQHTAFAGPTLIVTAPEEPHALRGDRRRRMVLTWFGLAVSGSPEPRGLVAAWLSDHKPAITLPQSLAVELATLQGECDAAQSAWSQAAVDRLRLFIIGALRHSAGDPGYGEAADADGVQIEAFLEQVRRAPHDGPTAVAKILGIHERQLTRLVRRGLGCSPLAAITRERMTLARLYLSNPDLSVVAIAERLGYGDARHFARIFRRVTGEAPALWRQNRYRR